MHCLPRRSLAALALCALALPALAQGPITLIVGWPAGGPSDNVARLAATRMSEALGQPITIDNRAGAGGNLGSDAAARARPDGNTIMLATVASHGLNSALYARLNHDPLKDFAPIGMITTSPSVLLVPVASPLRSVNDLLEAARARPGQLNYGSGGVGSSQHLAGASFKQLTGVDVTHIPYKGTAPAMTDLMAGRVDFVLTTGAIPFIRSGKLRALAVASRQRLPALPDVPTFEEAGVKGFYTDTWYGLVAPGGTPRA
ncbi:Bug family tripartite tricarboxylate transporter substrate binding protein, partial [Delftia acidovorans]|uniref:Bug family tripartite tricarboxylate transporter substrate binding protein n=1 Tax=Delftia acidovorans TaxID=80866 RepID=UPI00359F8989